jgi:hypothetical protein
MAAEGGQHAIGAVLKVKDLDTALLKIRDQFEECRPV